jgi:CHASE2 domain-containing sensor protein
LQKQSTSVPRGPFFILLVCGIAVLALYFAPLREQLLEIEHSTADWRSTLLADRIAAEHPKIAIVLINKDTAVNYPAFLPMPLDLVAKVVRVVSAAGPRAIGLVTYFVKDTGPRERADLLDAIRTCTSPIVLGAANESSTHLDALERQYQDDFLTQAKPLPECRSIRA